MWYGYVFSNPQSYSFVPIEVNIVHLFLFYPMIVVLYVCFFSQIENCLRASLCPGLTYILKTSHISCNMNAARIYHLHGLWRCSKSERCWSKIKEVEASNDA